MSIKYMTRVWSTPELKHGRLLLMLALADHANDAGECWPSQPHLEEKTRLTDRQLRRVITELCKADFLAISEKGVGRGKKTVYKLFPESEQKADILSEEKADIISEKADKMSEKSGQNVQEKADIFDEKADISDTNQSHARSEPPIEPTTEEPSEESSSSARASSDASANGDDDDDAIAELPEALRDTWQEIHGDRKVSAAVAKKLNQLVAECGIDAVAHGIRVSVNAVSRSFRYIAESARNYIPPAPAQERTHGNGRYSVDIPGVISMPPAAQHTPAPLPAAMPHDDFWAVCLSELSRELGSGFVPTLNGSRLEEVGMIAREGDGKLVPLYRVVIAAERAAAGLNYFTRQAGPAIRRKLGSVLGKPVQIEIVADSPSQPSMSDATRPSGGVNKEEEHGINERDVQPA